MSPVLIALKRTRTISSRKRRGLMISSTPCPTESLRHPLMLGTFFVPFDLMVAAREYWTSEILFSCWTDWTSEILFSCWTGFTRRNSRVGS